MTSGDDAPKAGNSSEVLARVRSVGPHNPDSFEAALDGLYAGQRILAAPTIYWGLLYPVNPDGWSPADGFEVLLTDARIRFVAVGESFDPNGAPDDNLEYPTCLVSVDTGIAGSIDRAKVVGRPAVRQAAALLMSYTRLLSGRQPLWEGPYADLGDRKLGFVQVRRSIQVGMDSPDGIKRTLAPLSTHRVLGGVDERVVLARRWYLRAWESSGLLDRFINFWLATSALYESHRPDNRDRERSGIVAYVEDLKNRIGFSGLVRDDITTKFLSAYTLRNDVFHEGRAEGVDAQAVKDLEEAVTRCIQYET